MIVIFPQTSAPAGKRGKLVTLGSRKELDCLLQFINDQFDEPAFEVTIISQGKGSKIYGKKLRHFPLGVRPHPHPRALNSICDSNFLTNRPLRSQLDLMLNERDVAWKIAM